jgi:hypothetical protein
VFQRWFSFAPLLRRPCPLIAAIAARTAADPIHIHPRLPPPPAARIPSKPHFMIVSSPRRQRSTTLVPSLAASITAAIASGGVAGGGGFAQCELQVAAASIAQVRAKAGCRCRRRVCREATDAARCCRMLRVLLLLRLLLRPHSLFAMSAAALYLVTTSDYAIEWQMHEQSRV